MDKLPQLLRSIDTWRWPKSDLFTWIEVLNKLDTVLEDVVQEYNIDNLQVNAFSPEKKQLICGILNFERLLLENSTNRKTFNSYDVRPVARCIYHLRVLIHISAFEQSSVLIRP